MLLYENIIQQCLVFSLVMEKLQKQTSKTQQREMEFLKSMTVPPIRSLLESAPPSVAVLGAYIDELDSQLDENSHK